MIIQWHITNECNLSCPNCYQNNYSSYTVWPDLILILKYIVDFAKKIKTKIHLNITGGEPFLHPNFFNLLEQIALYKKILCFGILSNGTSINSEVVCNLKKYNCCFVQISIDGNEKTHNELRGNGVYKKNIESLKLLKKFSITSMVSFTAAKKNHTDFSHVAELCASLKVDYLWADRLIPLRSSSISEIMNTEETECFFETMYAARQKFNSFFLRKTTIKMHRALQFLILKKYGVKKFNPYICSAGKSLITILPDLTVLPCRRMPVIAGNLKNETLEEIYNNSEILIKLRGFQGFSEGCEQCEHGLICGGGLKCLSYAINGSPFKTDPQCFFKKKS